MSRPLPPEARFIRPPGPRPPVESTPTIALNAPISSPIEELLNLMIDADEIYIVGRMPWECSQQLIRRKRELIEADTPPPPKTVYYFTTRPDRDGTRETLTGDVQRYIAGIQGMRNWLTPGRQNGASQDVLKVLEIRSDDGTCLVLIRKGAAYTAAILYYLVPSDRTGNASLVVARFDEAMMADIRRHIVDDLLKTSKPLEQRHVMCMEPSSDVRDGFNRILKRVTANQVPVGGETEPAAIVAVCGTGPEGPVVFLKNRDEYNAVNDFHRLSLISERLTVDDLVDWLGPGQLPDDDSDALDELFDNADQDLTLKLDFFRSAARRELFLSCGLNIDFDRLDFCGYRLVERENEGTYLGFAVFRLNLAKTPEFNEMRSIQRWSKAMHRVPISKLYAPENRDRLNRLLVTDREWLHANVFNLQPADGGRAE